MKQLLCLVTVALAVATATPSALAQITSTSSGGNGGAGGSAVGGSATGGSATNNTSGVSSASGGTASGGQGGSSSSTGGNSFSSGGSVGSVSTGGSSASLGDVTVNYNVPATQVPMGKAGLGVGVDAVTGAIVTDSTVTYQGSYKLKNTPDVSVGGPASGPCNGFSGGFGVSMAGFALGANTSTVDEGCSARETARVAAMIGRMDVANAILDNLPIVQAAMKAKAMREALALPARTSEAPATTAPARVPPAPVPVQTQEQREAALKEQQRLAQEALQRSATMAKVNDTLKFTDATTQASEKTPQEIMAEETTKKQLAAKADEAKTLQAKSSASPAPQQTNVSEAQVTQVTTAPLAMQQVIRGETIVPGGDTRKSPPNMQALSNVVQTAKPDAGKAAEMRGSSASISTEERVKAAKAALNLQ